MERIKHHTYRVSTEIRTMIIRAHLSATEHITKSIYKMLVQSLLIDGLTLQNIPMQKISMYTLVVSPMHVP